jgi:hypothetical protein
VNRLSSPSSAQRLAGTVLLALGFGVLLSACSNSGLTLAKQACSHIDQSITLLHEADLKADRHEAAQLKQHAYDQLRNALPLAAEAAYHDGQWQALMTTVSESNRVPETTLVSALQAQCGEVASSIFGQPAPPPSSIPGGPSSSSP